MNPVYQHLGAGLLRGSQQAREHERMRAAQFQAAVDAHDAWMRQAGFEHDLEWQRMRQRNHADMQERARREREGWTQKRDADGYVLDEWTAPVIPGLPHVNGWRAAALSMLSVWALIAALLGIAKGVMAVVG